jgi:hypothetical protein
MTLIETLLDIPTKTLSGAATTLIVRDTLGVYRKKNSPASMQPPRDQPYAILEENSSRMVQQTHKRSFVDERVITVNLFVPVKDGIPPDGVEVRALTNRVMALDKQAITPEDNQASVVKLRYDGHLKPVFDDDTKELVGYVDFVEQLFRA